MIKKELRVKYKKLREEVSAVSLEENSLAIANQLLKMDIWDKSYYHIFLPIHKQKEIDTNYILHILQGKDKHIVLPKTNFETCSLQHFLLSDNTILESNEWGVTEPVSGIAIPEKELEIVFVPLLSYDIHGNRVGYGKGFYDAFLKQCAATVITVGLSLFPPEKSIDDLYSADFPLDYCVTPVEIYDFRK